MSETFADEQGRGREVSTPATLDLARHFRELRVVAVPALVIAILFAVAVFAVRAQAPDQWSATVSVRADSESPGTASGGDAASAAALLDASYLALAADSTVLRSAATAAGVPWSAADAQARITIVEGSTPGLLVVTVLGDDAQQASAVAAQTVLTLSSAARTHQVDATTAQQQQAQVAASALSAQLQALAPTDPARNALQQRYQSQLDQLGALQVSGLSRLTALADPVTSDGPVSPKPLRDALLAFIAVLIAAAEVLVLLNGRLGKAVSLAWTSRVTRKHNAVFADCVGSKRGAARQETQRVESMVLRELRSGGDVLVLRAPPLSNPVLDTAILNSVKSKQAEEAGRAETGELVELSADDYWWRVANPDTVRLGVVVVAQRSHQRQLVLSILRWLADAGVPAIVMLTDKVGKGEAVQEAARPSRVGRASRIRAAPSEKAQSEKAQSEKAQSEKASQAAAAQSDDEGARPEKSGAVSTRPPAGESHRSAWVK